MKTALTLALTAIFGLSIVGCHASADVGDNADNGSNAHYKKTTTVDRNGNSSVKTEKSSSY